MSRSKLTAARMAATLTTAALVATACGSGGDSSDDSGSFKPSGAITIVTAFGAGGGTDKVARAMLDGLARCADVEGHVEYHEGSSGVTGYTYFKSQADDPNQVLATATDLTTLPMFIKDVPVSWHDFVPIALVSEDQVSVAVPGDSPIESLEDLVEEAKTRSVKVGVVGVTGPDNIVRLLLEQEAGIEFEPVVFDNGGETTAAILGGTVDAVFGGAGDIVGQKESGDARVLAVFGSDRYAEGPMADVPTASEQGVDVEFAQWRGLLGSPGMTDSQAAFYADCLEEWTGTDAYDDYIDTALALPKFAKLDEFKTYLEDQETLIGEVLDK